ncbi:hypothetical protein A3D03_02870 [Candidatus Gottesmanbacteria bacterium RIFCSPHIGHO2_02_FULL_40_13]|uniref:FAD-binding domain-containing protein n=1 Tax=Candidatus Gottesmanbacteria bacterium RIFCSPHIGHO2_02_FULL_40_13 TaxID=1798384 RepID=A0A1F6AA09_9BACT|nr:MAG: hypothetical protein A3D03_02870 [Candidatus Gottesmanbacteria bacterium RIFCSPHIGHO2_02_FULL_40_13]
MGLEAQQPTAIIPLTSIASEVPRRPEAREVIQFDGVVVVGARIAGSIAAYNLARHNIPVLCLDSQDVRIETSPSCTGCGGLVQNKTMELLETIGISLESVTRQVMDGYTVHLPHGGILKVSTPGMLALDRGFGPAKGDKRLGLDAFLLQTAIKAGVRFEVDPVEKIDLGQNGRAIVTTKNHIYSANFVMGAFGHSSIQEKISVPEGYKLDSAKTQKSAVYEFAIDPDFYEKNYDSKVRVVVVPMHRKDQNALFVAFVPKGNNRVSMIVLGKKDVTPNDIINLMASKYVTGLLPEDMLGEDQRWKKPVDKGGCNQCACTKNTITTRTPEHFAVLIDGGIVNIGDSAVTRLYKDGIGAAAFNAIRATNAYINKTLPEYVQEAKSLFPPDDHIWARILMELNDLAVRFPWSERRLIYLHNGNTLISPLVREHARKMLIGEDSYQNILSGFVHHALELAFHH